MSHDELEQELARLLVENARLKADLRQLVTMLEIRNGISDLMAQAVQSLSVTAGMYIRSEAQRMMKVARLRDE